MGWDGIGLDWTGKRDVGSMDFVTSGIRFDSIRFDSIDTSMLALEDLVVVAVGCQVRN